VDARQLNEFEMWFTKLGEKLNVLKWIVGGERKFEGCCCSNADADDADVVSSRVLQSKPFRRRIGE
jgi:hypothetical protein